MKTKSTFFLLCFSLLFLFNIKGQDTIPDLVITEAQLNTEGTNYIELTNMGDTALDLSLFSIETFNQFPVYWIPNTEDFRMRMSGILAPGQSYVISAVLEGLTDSGKKTYRPKMAAVSDLLIYPTENLPPGVKDSITDGAFKLLTLWAAKGCYAIRYFPSETDSFIIDAVNHSIGDDQKWGGLLSVAGIVDAALTHVLVRKFSVKQGTPMRNGESSWDADRGIDIDDSQWIPIPHKGADREGNIYRTVGNHGNFLMNVQSGNAGLTINLADSTMTVPWGIRRGDSIITDLILGDGMAWWYSENEVFGDSMYSTCQNGDILSLYACGENLNKIDFKLTISDPAENMNLVFPNRRKIYYEPGTDLSQVSQWGGEVYYVTEDVPGIDTIGNVAFAARVDTLFKNLQKAENASWEIVWVDGVKRVDLKNGDLLKVTAANASVKQYYIDVQEEVLSSNAQLSVISWPDIDLDEGWKADEGWFQGDTIPGFSGPVLQYNIKLPYGTRNVPALSATAEDPNAKITVKSATSLEGGIEEATSRFIVMAEDDSTEVVYKVLFNLELPPEHIVPFKADPIISEIVLRYQNRACLIEVYNPGNQTLDLSHYLFVTASGTELPDIISYDYTFARRYNYYVPGYKYTNDTTIFELNGRYLEIDPTINIYLEPQQTFVIGSWLDETKLNPDDVLPLLDIFFDEFLPNHLGVTALRGEAVAYHHGAAQADLVFHIENDSVLDGTKPLGDPADFTLVDVFGTYDGAKWNVAGQDMSKTNGWRVRRKPEFWHGNTDNLASFGTNAEDSEWIVERNDVLPDGHASLLLDIGSHALNPVTAHLSTVSSLVYKIDAGYLGDLNILGVSNGETVQSFYDNLIASDTAQEWKVIGPGSVEKASGDAVALDDTLIVNSANKVNITRYVISTAALDGNVMLIAKDGSELSINTESGTIWFISGMEFGASIKSVFENVETESDLSIINIIDRDGGLIPLKVARSDSGYYSTVVGKNVFFEVVPQNGISQLYELVPSTSASDPYVISSLYGVNNTISRISLIPEGTAVPAFLSNIEPAQGASVRILDKLGHVRMAGNLAYDDKLEVKSQDETKRAIYYLQFLRQTNPDFNMSPEVELAFADTTIERGTILEVMAMVTDDGNPVPPMLAHSWELEVINGNAGTVNISEPTKATTNVTFSEIGIFRLHFTSSDGELSDGGSVRVEVTFAKGMEAYSESAFRMYPNPARDNLTLEWTTGNEADVKIISLTGKTVMHKQLTGNQQNLNLIGLDAGVYFVHLRTGGETFTRKLNILR